LQGGGYGFLFRSEFFIRTTRELEYYFFFSNIGNQNIFFEEKNITPLPPFKLNGRSLIS
jgi:hypothetical protein